VRIAIATAAVGGLLCACALMLLKEYGVQTWSILHFWPFCNWLSRPFLF
jgi:hypothetical protein